MIKRSNKKNWHNVDDPIFELSKR